jgi:hypothetical protein
LESFRRKARSDADAPLDPGGPEEDIKMRNQATRAIGVFAAAVALAIGGAGIASADRNHPEDGPHHGHHHHGHDDHGHHGPNHT